MDEKIGSGLYQSCGTRGVLDVCPCLGCGGMGGVGGACVGGLEQVLEEWGDVMSV